MDTSPASVFVSSVHRPEPLKQLEDRFVNLDELNYLAKRMDGMSHGELIQFCAGASHEKYTSLKDLINLTFNLPRYTVVQHISDMEAVGRHHHLSKHQIISSEDAKNIDFAALGRELINSGQGIVTELGILFKNEDVPYYQVYDGQTFPEYNYYGDELLTVEAKYAGRIETLYLPCEDLAITKAIYRLGCNSADEIDFTVADANFENTPWFARFQKLMTEVGIYQVNEVTRSLNYATMDLPKLDAVMQYANRSDVSAIIAMADHLDHFVFLPGVTGDDEVAEYFIEHNEAYSLHSDLVDYFDYDGFGQHLAANMDGKYVDDGYVCMAEDCSLEQVLQSAENQVMTYGGM